MTEIIWDDKYSVWNDEIDAQHKKWISIYNELSSVLLNHKSKEIDSAIIDALKAIEEYTRYHFDFEEEYMRKINYPDLIAHRRKHKDFDSKIYEYNRKIREDRVVLGTEVLKEIRNWFLDHILIEDKKYAQSPGA